MDAAADKRPVGVELAWLTVNEDSQTLVQQMIGSARTVNDSCPRLSNRPSSTSMDCELSAGINHWHYPLFFPPSSQAPHGEGTIALLPMRQYAASASPKRPTRDGDRKIVSRGNIAPLSQWSIDGSLSSSHDPSRTLYFELLSGSIPV
ncbi:hypothetical protein PMG11_06487 [Penicillium brasilianum]|uniref:Uncharacterized protein n=1 Tax=Penicillium brasilianum TaxID=104259 RepID=A0A0F7TLZ5_PENBI|nr:hypothetical protein PMG11_06487 [Penicillium brasilianum]